MKNLCDSLKQGKKGFYNKCWGLWKPYVDIANVYFPNATIIVDKYHFIRYVTWAIDKVRKRLLKTIPNNLRKYYKRSRKLILTRYAKRKDENKKAYDLMLLYNDNLRLAHYLKGWFYEICQSKKYSYQRPLSRIGLRPIETGQQAY